MRISNLKKKLISTIFLSTLKIELPITYITKLCRLIFEIEEEAYVNDIPFNTQKVFVEKMFRDALNEVFTFEDELYIDDIPETILNKITQTLMLTLEEIVIATIK